MFWKMQTCGQLKKLNVSFKKEFSIDMVLNAFPSSYAQFIVTYHLNITLITLMELHNLLQPSKAGIKKPHPTTVATTPVLVIHQGKGEKRKAIIQPKWKGKAHIGDYIGGSKGKANYDVPLLSDPKEAVFFHYA